MTTINQFDINAQRWDLDLIKVNRAMAVSEAIRKHLPITQATRAFEYGCGTGLLSFFLQPQLGEITLADSSPGMLKVLNDKIAETGALNMRAIQLDLEIDPAPNEIYDLVYSLMTFHHIADTSSLLENLFAMISSGGVLCVADLDAEDGSFHGEGFAGHKGFERHELETKALQAGFDNVVFITVFHMRKPESSGQTDFPIFLMVAEKK